MKPALQKMLQKLTYEKEKTTARNMKIMEGDKHTVKVVNQPYIKLVGRLKDKSSKINYNHNNQLWDIQNKKI